MGSESASDTVPRGILCREIFCRSLSETMVLPLGVVVRVLRERRVVERLPLAWRTAVRPSRMRRRAPGWAQCDAAAIGRAECRLRRSLRRVSPHPRCRAH